MLLDARSCWLHPFRRPFSDLPLATCPPLLWNVREYTHLRICAPTTILWVFGTMEFLAQTFLILLPGPVWTSSLGHTHKGPHMPGEPGMGGEGSGQRASDRSWGRLLPFLEVPDFKNSNSVPGLQSHFECVFLKVGE